jgi:hypothetical protein
VSKQNWKRSRVTAEEFVRIWQGADSVEQVSEQTGLYHGACVTRARSYRERGVPLQELPKRRTLRNDWKALRELAVELRPGSE